MGTKKGTANWVNPSVEKTPHRTRDLCGDSALESCNLQSISVTDVSFFGAYGRGKEALLNPQ
jgi:hypothetical protein